MDITPNNLSQVAFVELDTAYQAQLTKTPIYWPEFVSRLPSKSRIQYHAFLDAVPNLRQWIGPRQVENLQARLIAQQNETFEQTLGISRDVFEDDEYMIYAPAVAMQARASQMWVDNVLIKPLLQGGTATASIAQSYDGVPFFSGSHPVNAGRPSFGSAQVNLLNYATTGADQPLSLASYQLAVETMKNFLGADGNPLGLVPNVLLVDPSLEQVAREITEQQNVAIGFSASGPATSSILAATVKGNVWKGSAKPIVWPALQNQPGTWYLLCTDMPIRPFIYQDRVAPQFTMMTNPNDPNVFTMNNFEFGVRARGAGAFGMWWCAICAQPTH